MQEKPGNLRLLRGRGLMTGSDTEEEFSDFQSEKTR
jgi:hypothetical protein